MDNFCIKLDDDNKEIIRRWFDCSNNYGYYNDYYYGIHHGELNGDVASFGKIIEIQALFKYFAENDLLKKIFSKEEFVKVQHQEGNWTLKAVDNYNPYFAVENSEGSFSKWTEVIFPIQKRVKKRYSSGPIDFLYNIPSYSLDIPPNLIIHGNTIPNKSENSAKIVGFYDNYYVVNYINEYGEEVQFGFKEDQLVEVSPKPKSNPILSFKDNIPSLPVVKEKSPIIKPFSIKGKL